MSTNETSSPVTYWDYIHTEKLFSIQTPRTEAHDEMQFIMVHQVFELWFKLAIYELQGALRALDENDLLLASQRVRRVASILRTSLHGFDPLMTMTQQGYAEFRDALAPASGFQSHQFRVIEILLGIERVQREESEKNDEFYWENAVQAGVTFTLFMEKYHTDLLAIYNDAKDRNLRRSMLRITEETTGKKGADAYRHLLVHRDEYPTLTTLAESARDIQQAMLDFRLHHHKVTVFTVGAHAPGTSDSHKDPAPSCASYLLGVIRDRSTIFPEMEEGMH
jgi:tryptophan 2,3-dioxygenase